MIMADTDISKSHKADLFSRAHARASDIKQRRHFLVTTGLDPVVYAEVLQ